MLRVFYCTSFKGFYPVGVSLIVAAATRAKAKKLAEAELAQRGLEQTLDIEDLNEFVPIVENCQILQDGDY
jgi:hypothetical protein